ncbi:type II toxin-antitoxin system VapC family toxin [Aestuariimicrobium ganziense]|uniref:type II toxin-antitoxin system VapC family toxin n=1 Tax=Aestuariimicrobium ganziense TaxID=2773677 RepID=UPI001945B895|nr:type II toxin-antitoxin system VapC family toxin [Aestuariimicrobium ganziense]
MMVVDASLAMAWCFEDERTPATDAALAEVVADGGVVPDLWGLEVANVLLTALRRKRITEARMAHLVELLESLPLEHAETEPTISELIDLAERHSLSAYDAVYLSVAMREGLALGTLDQSLRAAATSAGVPLAL